MKYLARKPFRYGNRIYLTGDTVAVMVDDVRMLQGQGKIGGLIREAAVIRPAETAVREKPETAIVKLPEKAVLPEAKHLGRGWYELSDGRKVRKKDLEAGD